MQDSLSQECRAKGSQNWLSSWGGQNSGRPRSPPFSLNDKDQADDKSVICFLMSAKSRIKSRIYKILPGPVTDITPVTWPWVVEHKLPLKKNLRVENSASILQCFSRCSFQLSFPHFWSTWYFISSRKIGSIAGIGESAKGLRSVEVSIKMFHCSGIEAWLPGFIFPFSRVHKIASEVNHALVAAKRVVTVVLNGRIWRIASAEGWCYS